MARRQGRPTKFKEEFIEQAEKLCKLGATDVDLADFFKVHISTIYEWKNTKDGFSEALKAYKHSADDNVERSLYQRATGYQCLETKVFNQQGDIITHEVIKQYPPDPTAAIFWLKNRRPEEWREQKEETDTADVLADAMAKLADKLPS